MDPFDSSIVSFVVEISLQSSDGMWLYQARCRCLVEQGTFALDEAAHAGRRRRRRWRRRRRFDFVGVVGVGEEAGHPQTGRVLFLQLLA